MFFEPRFVCACMTNQPYNHAYWLRCRIWALHTCINQSINHQLFDLMQLPLLKAIFLPLIKEIGFGRTQIYNFRTPLMTFL